MELTLILILLISVPYIIASFFLFRYNIQKNVWGFLTHFIILTLINIWGIATLICGLEYTILNLSQLNFYYNYGVISILSAELLFLYMFSNMIFGKNFQNFTFLTIFLITIVIGAKQYSFLLDSYRSFGLLLSGNKLSASYDLNIIILTTLSQLFFCSILILSDLKIHKFPNYLVSDRLKSLFRYSIYFLIIGGIIDLLSFFIFGKSEFLFRYGLILGAFIIVISYYFLIIHLMLNPLFNLKPARDVNMLFSKGIFGWVLIKMGDKGPQAINYSTEFLDLYHISKEQLQVLAVSSLTVVGVNNSFRNMTFLVPFPELNKLIYSVCISFQINDETIKDERLKSNALCILSLIIPFQILPLLGFFEELTIELEKYLANYTNLSDLNEKQNLEKISLKLIRKALSYN